MGRTILVALAVAVVVAVVLAVVIPWQVERYLIEGETRTIARISSDFSEEGLIRSSPGTRRRSLSWIERSA